MQLLTLHHTRMCNNMCNNLIINWTTKETKKQTLLITYFSLPCYQINIIPLFIFNLCLNGENIVKKYELIN